MSDKRDAYVAKLKARLDKWNGKIDDLEVKAQKAGADSKAEFQKQIEIVKSKRDEIVDKVEKLRESSDSAWKELKVGIKGSWKALDTAVRSAASKF